MVFVKNQSPAGGGGARGRGETKLPVGEGSPQPVRC